MEGGRHLATEGMAPVFYSADGSADPEGGDQEELAVGGSTALNEPGFGVGVRGRRLYRARPARRETTEAGQAAIRSLSIENL